MNGFVDLDEDTLLEVYKRVDMKTLLRAACVNKLWYTTAQNEQLWFPPISLRFLASTGMNRRIDGLQNNMVVVGASSSSSTAASSVVDAGTSPQTPSLETASAAAAASEDNSPIVTES